MSVQVAGRMLVCMRVPPAEGCTHLREHDLNESLCLARLVKHSMPRGRAHSLIVMQAAALVFLIERQAAENFFRKHGQSSAPAAIAKTAT